MADKPRRLIVMGGLAALLVIGAFYALATPLWKPADEPWHYKYIYTISTYHRLPTLFMHDPGETYQAHHTPVYYLLGAGVYSLAGGASEEFKAKAVRLFSLTVFAASIVILIKISGMVFPDRPSIALGALGFTLGIPNLFAAHTAISNDVMVTFFVFCMALAGLKMLRGDIAFPWDAAALGAAFALAVMSKISGVYHLPVAGLLFYLKYAGEKRPGRFLARVAIFTAVAAVPVGWWVHRNMALYGDALGMNVLSKTFNERLIDHLTLKTLLVWAAQSADQFWNFSALYRSAFAQGRMFFGFHILFALFSIPPLIGVYFIFFRHWRCLNLFQKRSLVVLGTMIVLCFGGFFTNAVFSMYNTGGRHMYPALAGIALLSSYGLNSIPFVKNNKWALPAIIALLILTNVLCLFIYAVSMPPPALPCPPPLFHC